MPSRRTACSALHHRVWVSLDRRGWLSRVERSFEIIAMEPAIAHGTAAIERLHRRRNATLVGIANGAEPVFGSWIQVGDSDLAAGIFREPVCDGEPDSHPVLVHPSSTPLAMLTPEGNSCCISDVSILPKIPEIPSFHPLTLSHIYLKF